MLFGTLQEAQTQDLAGTEELAKAQAALAALAAAQPS